MKKLLGALAIVVLALMASAPAAEAHRCWSNGYRWVCGHHHHNYARAWYPRRSYAHYRYRPYYRSYYRPYYYGYYRPYYRPYYGYYRPYYRNYAYACIPPFCW